MFRRETRSSIVHINNDKERDITLYKGHGGLYIGATDLSILNGARVTIILQAENANIHSFGTPSAKPIVDAFLSGTTPSINKVKASKIARLQREVARLNMEKTIEDKRNQIAILHMKKIQDENPDLIHEQPPPQDLHLQKYPSPCNAWKPLQNTRALT
uniref:Uncharacterized protein n=1 Tax=Avena sativa TaxID=4498 RepID=A0ACD5ZZG0_AVESA